MCRYVLGAIGRQPDAGITSSPQCNSKVRCDLHVLSATLPQSGALLLIGNQPPDAVQARGQSCTRRTRGVRPAMSASRPHASARRPHCAARLPPPGRALLATPCCAGTLQSGLADWSPTAAPRPQPTVCLQDAYQQVWKRAPSTQHFPRVHLGEKPRLLHSPSHCLPSGSTGTRHADAN